MAHEQFNNFGFYSHPSLPVVDFGLWDQSKKNVFEDWLFGGMSTTKQPVLAGGILSLSNVTYASKPVPQHGAGVRFAGVRLRRNGWTATGSDIVTVTAEVSENGGGAWSTLVTFAADGGDIIDRRGNKIPESIAEVLVSWSPNTARLTRITINNTASINTQADMVYR